MTQQMSKFRILTNRDNSKVRNVIESEPRLASLPSFVGKIITTSFNPRARFYHRSVSELRREETERLQFFTY